jgi:hypothetical protein
MCGGAIMGMTVGLFLVLARRKLTTKNMAKGTSLAAAWTCMVGYFSQKMGRSKASVLSKPRLNDTAI